MAENLKKLPLTNVQRAYLIGRTSSFEMGGCSTHVYYEFINELYPERFDKAFNEIIAEQPMLRAVINSNGDEIIPEKAPEYHSPVFDWTNKSQEEINNLIEKQREKYSHEVMPSDVWPLFKFEFAKLPSGKYYLFASFDLLIVDAGSFASLGGELYNKYNNIKNENEIGSFEKYLELIENRKAKKKYNSDKTFWEDIIEDMPSAPEIPMLASGNNERNIFTRKQFFIDSETWSKVKNHLSEMNVSSTVGVLSAYSTVLGFWSNQERFTLNLPMTNLIRRKKGMERVLGDFTEEMLLPLNKYNFVESFDDYVVYVNAEFMKYFKHNYFDGIELMALIRSKTGENVKMPIVYTGMISDKSEFDNIDFFGEMVYGVSQTPQVTLDCQVFETHGQLKVVWDYIERMFVSEEINSMFEQFISLISAIGNENIHISDIVRVSDNQAEMLNKYNSTDKNIPLFTLNDIFTNAFNKYPDKKAVSDHCSSITYSELDSLSDKAASALISKGISYGDRVAVIGNRNKETIINIIGILKAGAVYVPINPQYPEERRNYICQNSKCVYIIDGAEYEDSDNFEIRKTSPSDTAYIIYTSGSTGTPKGVVIKHDSVCNTIIDINEKFGITSEDKILCVSSFGFDLSVYDIFGAIYAGAEVIIAQDNKNIKNIAELIESNGITVWNSVPSIMELVAESLPDGYKNYSLKNVFLSGDWIPVSLPDKIKAKYPVSKIISLGGATEGSIWSIYYEINNVDGLNSIPYGYPLGNQKMYLLDEQGNQAAYETEAEIYIGGRGVAVGYDNNQEKTDSAFIEHEKLGRIYRTGDFGMMKRSGYMEFRGRRDQQVKIHGYRVELGEIETALQKMYGINKAVVDINKNENNSYDILAYIVSALKDVSENEYNMDNFNSDMEQYVKNMALDFSAYDLNLLNIQLEKISTFYMKKFFSSNAVSSKKGDIIDIDAFIEENSFDKKYRNLMIAWLDELCSDGFIIKDKEKYVFADDLENNDIEKLWNELDAVNGSEQIKFLKEYIRTCCEKHEELFKGEIMPVSLFFHDSSSDVAKNIYTDNPVADYTNRIARKAITEIVKKNNSQKKPFRILEVGAGIGGTSAQLFSELAGYNIEYEFSDISEYFLNNSAERFAEYDFIKYRFLDINKDLQAQGCSYNSYDMVLAVNVMHDAECLDDTIEYIISVLKTGGYFVMIETTSNLRSQMVSLGFLEGLNPVYNDIRDETKKAFMNEEQWSCIFEKHGMTLYNYIKDSEMKKIIWQNVFIAKNKESYAVTGENDIICSLKEIFPDYMIPSRILRLNSIPLTLNGKVNKNKLPKIMCSKARNVYEAPVTEMEKKFADIWQNILNINRIGIKDNFFELGGDSLNAIKIVTMSEKEGITIQLSDLYKYSTIEELAKAAVYSEETVQEAEGGNIYEGLSEEDISNILSAL